MAGKKQKPEEKEQRDSRPRPFWSGIVAFGLVSLPVSLFPANRGNAIRLSMVDEDGTPLRRRYFCTKDDKELDREDIVRGYPVDKDTYVLVEDEELEALAPDKTREIDLQRFVPLDQINPVFFERGYYLTPDSGSTKAYRLLARSMEEENKAGIATLVMRDREYIIAIMSERGILRAETLRFQDEIRSPDDIGLPALEQPGKTESRKVTKAIQSLSQQELDPATLADRQAARIRKLAEQKLSTGTDVIEEPAQEDEEQVDEVIDLIQVLKQRLEGRKAPPSKPGEESLNRDELYEKAREQHIPGRSKMSKKELQQALKQSG